MSEGAVPASFMSGLNSFIRSHPTPGVIVTVAEEPREQSSEDMDDDDTPDDDTTDEGDNVPVIIINTLL